MHRAGLLLLGLCVMARGQDTFPQDLSEGVKLIQEGRFRDALVPLARANASRPDAFEPNYLLGLALFQERRGLEAIRHLRAGQNARPGHAGLLTLLGILYLQEDYPLDAAEALELAGSQTPLDEKRSLLLADAWHQCFQFDKAMRSAMDTAARFPRSADAKFRAGYELETAGRFDEAQSGFAGAVELRPDFIEARVALARLDRRFGRYESARRHLQMALGANPKHRQARLEMAKLSTARKENAHARELLEGLIAENDGDPELHSLLARVFQDEGNGAASDRQRERFLQLTRSEQGAGGMSGTIPSRKTRRFHERN
ncbi:MAG TPA: tetratricopeptide repeat protein [Bryobacteraceae bacterium]|nr:tetratricopeptide repeat protein [Bryobacteraceae bacterium]